MVEKFVLSFGDFLLFSEEFLLDEAKTYRYMSCGHLNVSGVDDSAEFKLTIDAMNIMGISVDDQSGMFTVLIMKTELSYKLLQ